VESKALCKCQIRGKLHRF